MRTKISLSIFIIVVSTVNSIGQDKVDSTPNQLTNNEAINFLGMQDIDVNGDLIQFKSPVSRFKDDIKTLFNESTLSLLFTNKLGTAFGGSNDLSLQRYFLSLDASDNSFSIGYNIDNRRGNELKQLNWIFGAGVKIVSKNKFATLLKSDDFLEDNIGITIKGTWVGNGRIKWGKGNKADERKKIIEKNREFLYHKYNEKVKLYNNSEFITLTDFSKEMNSIKDGAIDLNSKLSKKSDELFIEMIKEELKFIDENKLFKSLLDWWASGEAYLPLGDTFYNITPITNDNKASKAQYYAFNIKASMNGYYESSSWLSIFGSIEASIIGNNNIAVDGLEEKEFQSIITNSDGGLTISSPVSAIDIDEYERFVTPSIKAEIAFFYKNTVGISPSIEKNFGTYDEINWKFGIPVSLKDKDGKPTINFELQWRENNTLNSNQHLIGFSTSFIFGSLTQ